MWQGICGSTRPGAEGVGLELVVPAGGKAAVSGAAGVRALELELANSGGTLACLLERRFPASEVQVASVDLGPLGGEGILVSSVEVGKSKS